MVWLMCLVIYFNNRLLNFAHIPYFDSTYCFLIFWISSNLLPNFINRLVANVKKSRKEGVYKKSTKRKYKKSDVVILNNYHCFPKRWKDLFVKWNNVYCINHCLKSGPEYITCSSVSNQLIHRNEYATHTTSKTFTGNLFENLINDAACNDAFSRLRPRVTGFQEGKVGSLPFI